MNLDAMKELVAAVEAEAQPSYTVPIVYAAISTAHQRHLVYVVLDGGMEAVGAALALREALLPGWGYAVTSDSAVTGKPLAVVYGDGRSHEAEAPTPAQALLIATLRGKIAEMEGTTK